MHSPALLPATRDLVLIGGGHTHALVLLRWAMAPLVGTRLTVINPGPTAPYTGMLPGHIAGHYPRAALDIDLVRLARHAGARIILGRAEGIDRKAGFVHVPGRPPVGYDLASLDIGITSDLPSVPGYAAHAVSAKPLAAYADAWEGYLRRLRQGGAGAAQVVIIGAGVAGVELALATMFRLRREGHADAEVRIVEAAARPLPGVGDRGRARLLDHLARAGVEVICGATVAEVAADAVRLSDGRSLPATFTLGAAGTRPQGWLAATGLAMTDGFVTVGPSLRSTTDPAIFAVGDCAHLAHAPRPKAGVFAVRAAPVLHDNLRAALTGQRLRPYRPQRDYLKLVSTGDRAALAEKWGFALEGRWLWRIKDRIDARFMERLNAPRPMPAPDLPELVTAGVLAEATGSKPLCAGCGAKAGSAALAEALRVLPARAREDLRTGPGDDAAVIDLGGGRLQVLTTDHLRAFTDDPWLMARLAALHALGDVWAMGAAPQVALVNVILPRLSERLQTRTLAEILAGASGVLRAAGAEIAGGHTSVGAELTIGLTVTGLAQRAVPKGGARPGDALILTRGIGSGTVLAAEMAGAAPGGVVAALLSALSQPQGEAAALIAPHAHAMTDVTGFGLAGHLWEMLAASPATGARLDPDAVPLLPGAAALARAGHASTLAPANRAALAGLAHLPDGPLEPLAHDPQTCGPLLAAVPAEAAPGLLAALRAAGYADAAEIGRVTSDFTGLRAG